MHLRKPVTRDCTPSSGLSGSYRPCPLHNASYKIRCGVLIVVMMASGSRAARGAEDDFVHNVRPIFEQHCYSCHGAEKQKSGLRLDIRQAAFRGGDVYGPAILPGQPDASPLIDLVAGDDPLQRMPPEGSPLSVAEVETLRNWVETGAVWPEGVDEAQLEDRTDHWSFYPPERPDLPTVKDLDWPSDALDYFILSRLEAEGLHPAPPADPLVWLRRVTLDLTGLPPTLREISDYVQAAEQDRSAADAVVVDRLLASPRYGERWAQHWLDVVRFAETHGFEVNTERPNAWPYRDYVIDSFNADLPYDQFIREQIAGDALGVDAATGFLVTASVLLPGQIGKDEPSKRLARQDALDEIVNNISQTFLGLSIGCARCHDHKFDPVSAEDYYAMQAFVAGVEYGERPLRSKSDAARRLQADELQAEVARLDRQLEEYALPAVPGRTGQDGVTRARKNTVRFESQPVRFVRFTILDANLHPTLGLIEPCIDEFEILSGGVQPRNVALASEGARVTASGSQTSASHQLSFIHDGRYGNASSWMSDSVGQGWIEFELPKPEVIDRVIWSRDREGKFSDRLATAYKLEVGLHRNELSVVAEVRPLRPPVRATRNIDRFAPVTTSRLRFTVVETNRYAPCIDELEVYNAAGQNIALRKAGAVVRTSGNKIHKGRHEPQFINDGRYGNSSSWMSDAVGSGWVEVSFSGISDVDRVVWGRDRLGEFDDRLALKYRIEVWIDDHWHVVADSEDRHPMDVADRRPGHGLVAGLFPKEAKEAQRLINRRSELQKQIEALSTPQMAFAGRFRQPDDIYILRRGDPEQPTRTVFPAVPVTLGRMNLSEETGEQERRLALGQWLTSVKNPLTARVMMNRLWQWHVGVGLVETSNDLGRNGMRPTHPKLLDWLASEFASGGWSLKAMHRRICLSSTYKQSSRYNAGAAKLDQAGRLLWRFTPRRLEAEAIRDGMLAAAGTLNLKTGGRGFSLFNKRGGLTGFVPVESFSGDGLRRMIYAHRVRRERDAVFGAFDCPDGGQSTPRRMESITPVQSLNLLNSRVTLEQSAALAERVRREAPDGAEQQIRHAYLLTVTREPTREEIMEALPIVREFGMAALCRALFNSSEFVFLP